MKSKLVHMLEQQIQGVLEKIEEEMNGSDNIN
jgi:hypothetical protein